MIHRTIWLTITLVSTICLTACADMPIASEADLPQPLELGDGWQIASLSEVGVDAGQITQLVSKIRNGEMDHLHSLLLVKDGKLVFEDYYRGYNAGRQHFVASVTKSVTSLLIGIAIDQGAIAGPDQYLSDLLPTYADLINADPVKRELRVWHLLTMTSGLEWDEESYPYSDMRNDCRRLDSTRDGPKLALSRPMSQPPGTSFEYSCADSMLLSAVIESATGLRADQYARQFLFQPLGISRYVWERYGDGLAHTDGGLHLLPRDMAKIGYLTLNKGIWQGRQIISSEWIAESTKQHVSANPIAGYGYQWWHSQMPLYLQNVETFFAAGTGGQQILIAPEIDLVMVVTSDEQNHEGNVARNQTMLTEDILPATMPIIWSKIVVWAWTLLSGTALIGLIWRSNRGSHSGLRWHWLPLVIIFGPLGWLAYCYSQHLSKTEVTNWGRARDETLFSVTGNGVGMLLWIGLQTLYLPQSDAGLMIFLAPLLTGMLLFRAPRVALQRNTNYWRALRYSWLPEIISTGFVLSGMLPLLILLTLRWFPFQMALMSPLFWFMISLGAISGTVTAFPFHLWSFWSGVDHQKELPADHSRGVDDAVTTGLTWRTAWGALLLSLLSLVASVGLTLARLS